MDWEKDVRGLYVVTLALGSQPRQGLISARDKKEAKKHISLLRMQKKVQEWTLTLPRQLPFGELEFRWTSEYLGSNYRGQNPLDWGVLYIIEKLLKWRCLKWACMTHLDI
jgi:hypothetical protein